MFLSPFPKGQRMNLVVVLFCFSRKPESQIPDSSGSSFWLETKILFFHQREKKNPNLNQINPQAVHESSSRSQNIRQLCSLPTLLEQAPGELCSPGLCRSRAQGTVPRCLLHVCMSAFLHFCPSNAQVLKWQLQAAFAGTHTQPLSHTFASHGL